MRNNGKIWESKTPIGTFSVRTDWSIPLSELGKFKPFWNGCGIGPGYKTLIEAFNKIQDWCVVHYTWELRKAEERLKELQKFKGILNLTSIN